MKVDIWMPIYINDYLADTMRLDAEKHGVYLLLMMDYWKHKELPSDMFELAMIARVQEDNKSLVYILNNFFTLENNKYKHKRIEKELEAASSRRESARVNGKKGGRPKKNPQKTHRLNEGKPTENPQGNPQKSSSPSHTPKGVLCNSEPFPLDAEGSIENLGLQKQRDEVNKIIISLQDSGADQKEIDHWIDKLHNIEDQIYTA